MGLLLVALGGACGEDVDPTSGAVTDAHTAEASGTDAGCLSHGDCPDDANPCTRAVCTPGGCVQQHRDEGASCSDGEPCTEPDACQAGVCVPGPERCACRDDARCRTLLGEDKCLGTPWCDQTAVPYVCRRKLDAPVCDPSKDHACAEQRCDPTTGACALTPVNQGGACSDGDPCTADDACVKGICFGATPSCQCQLDVDCPDDGDPCNGQLYCDTQAVTAEGKPTKLCKTNPATVVTCATKDVGPCKAFACDPKDGACKVMPLADGAACEDGDPCTSGDLCASGGCAPGPDVCTCSKQADCAAQEDGDLCNGVLYCDLSSAKCKVNPKTVVTCASSDDTACVKNLCNPKTGTCAPTPVLPGTPCDDGDSCTKDEICVAGACGKGTNVCPCTSHADCAGKDDGNRCNGTAFCNQQTKQCEQNAGAEIVCSTADDTACVKNACKRDDPKGSCALTPVELALEVPSATGGVRWEVRPAGMPPGVTAVCDDGDACTVGDLCQAGACKPQIYGCSCKADSDCADDGDLCNGLPYCDKSDPQQAVCKTKPNTQVVCKTVDDTACLKNTCAPKTGQCAPVPVTAGAPCDDGNPCTKSDYCVLGSCTGGAVVCVCQKDEDCKGKEDGNQCNGTLYCDKSDPAKPACKVNPATVVSCPGQALAPCQQWTCNPSSGQCLLVAGDEGKGCDDGSACTSGDVCKGGQCSGEAKPCDDKDACTVDGCNAQGSCTHTKVNCDDGNSCTVDQCNKSTGGCVNSALAVKGKTCDGDGSGCTVNDTCDQGVCKTGEQVSCPSGSAACVAGVCASLGSFDFKCVTTTAPDGAACDDGDACSVTSACSKGVCQASGKEALYSKLHSPSVGARGGYRGVAPRSDGGALVAGWSASPKSGAPTWSGWWVVRAGPDGAQVWQAQLASPKPHGDVSAVAVRETNAGQVLVLGTLVSASGDLDATAAVWSAEGKLQWQKSVGVAKTPDGVRGATPWPSGGFAAAGWQGAAGAQDGVMTRVSSGGQVIWRTLVGGAGDQRLTQVAVRPDGGAVAVGVAPGETSGTTLGLVAQTDAAGKVVWTHKPGAASQQALAAVTALGDGDTLAAGWSGAYLGGKRWLVRYGPDGAVRWSKVSTSSAAPLAMARVGSRLLLAGSATAGAQQSLWLLATDGLGNQVWDGGFAGASRAQGLAATADAVWVVGESESQGALLRRNAWGHGTCAAAAGCNAKALSDCDDGKPCTQDSCAKGTCTHANAVGWGCDPKDGCSTSASCVQGACKVSGPGRLYTTALSYHPDVSAVPSAWPHPDGGAVVGFYRGVGKLARYGGLDVAPDGSLRRVLDQNKTTLKIAALSGMLVLGDGSILSVWRSADDEVMAERYTIGADNHKTTLWSKTICTPTVQDWCASKSFSHCGTGRVFTSADGQQAYWVSNSTDQGVQCKVPSYFGKYWAACRQVRAINVTTGAVSSKHSMCANRYAGPGAAGHKGTEWLTTNGGRGLPGGGLVLFGKAVVYTYAGETSSVKHRSAWVERVGAGYLWRRHYFPEVGFVSQVHDVAKVPGGLMLVGDRRSGIILRRLLIRVNEAGLTLWSKEPPENPLRGVRALLPDAAGVLLVGDRTTTKGRRPFMQLLDLKGAEVWQRTWDHLDMNTWVVRNAWRVAGGDVVAGGVVVDKGIQRMFTLRASRWGHPSCADAGACAKAPVDCDDKDPCTADLCDGKTGKCVAKPSSGAACDDGDAATTGDVCAAGSCVGKKAP